MKGTGELQAEITILDLVGMYTRTVVNKNNKFSEFVGLCDRSLNSEQCTVQSY